MREEYDRVLRNFENAWSEWAVYIFYFTAVVDFK